MQYSPLAWCFLPKNFKGLSVSSNKRQQKCRKVHKSLKGIMSTEIYQNTKIRDYSVFLDYSKEEHYLHDVITEILAVYKVLSINNQYRDVLELLDGV